MITVYTSPSCQSCRKVKKWFEEQHIDFIEKNIFASVLDENELRDMLVKSENGTEDIISSRSKIVKDSGVDINSMTIKQIIAFIKEHPSVLKRPIMVDDRKIQVGYNSDEITAFIPAARRIAEYTCMHECTNAATCPHFNDCVKGHTY